MVPFGTVRVVKEKSYTHGPGVGGEESGRHREYAVSLAGSGLGAAVRVRVCADRMSNVCTAPMCAR